MNEYQYLNFKAIDKPLDDKHLGVMVRFFEVSKDLVQAAAE